MSEQSNDAAERSAHVTRGLAAVVRAFAEPCVEIEPGVWKLRVLVEAEAKIVQLETDNMWLLHDNTQLNAQITTARDLIAKLHERQRVDDNIQATQP